MKFKELKSIINPNTSDFNRSISTPNSDTEISSFYTMTCKVKKNVLEEEVYEIVPNKDETLTIWIK